jgi:hypothetical protein
MTTETIQQIRASGLEDRGVIEVRGHVVDAGGGEVRVLVDRDTLEYPAVGAAVTIRGLDTAE